MAGHSSNKNTRKEKNGSLNTDNTCNNVCDGRQQNEQQQPQLDIDELAREKVREVESNLDPSTWSCSLDFLDSSLSILKQIITAADLHRTNDKEVKATENQSRLQDMSESIYADFTDDNEQFNANTDLTEQFATNSVKWTIRVQAFKLVHRLVQIFVDVTPYNSSKSKSTIIKHLPDLIRLSFVAATSPYDELKMQGFEMFRYLIDKFSRVEEKEFVGHSILEQYKTQVLSAVKPAFNPDAPPYITAIASQICSLWICQGLEKDSNDIKRTHHLMLLSLEKLEGQSRNQNSKLYTESELEQERVDILGSWAQLYLASRELELSNYGRVFSLSPAECNNLYNLVKPQIRFIVDKWWEALKDYALLIMPAPRVIGVCSHDDENVYTREVALKLFEPTWPKLILATTIWLCKDSIATVTDCQSSCVSISPKKSHKQVSNEKYTKFICGIIMKELSRRQVTDTLARLPDSANYAIRALNLLLTQDETRAIIIDDMQIAQEFYTALYSIVITYNRGSHRLVARNTLDFMFRLITDHVKHDIRSLYFGLVKLVGRLMNAMKNMEMVVKHKHELSELDGARLHLSIVFHNLISLTKAAPQQIFSEPQLLEAVIIVFQESFNFEIEPNFILGSIEQLNQLYSVIPVDNRNHFIKSIFGELCNHISKLFRSLYNKSPSENDKLYLSMWNAFTRSARGAIVMCNEVDRSSLINNYVMSLVTDIDINEELAESEGSKRKRDLLDACINQLSALLKVVAINLHTTLDKHVSDRHTAVVKFHIDTKGKLESKIAQKKQTIQSRRVTSSGTRAQAVKITLKSDFSNFYSK